jgi:hypothetical protein
MKKVLLIAYYYPPLGGIGTQRSQKFARYLGEYGYLLRSYAAFKSGTETRSVAADLSAYERKAGARKLVSLLNELTAAPISAI